MVEWITQTLEQMGYLGVALLMFAENIFPPIPSELIMPFAGFAAARGDVSLRGVLLAGTVGTLLGTLPWYYLGRTVGCERLARWADRHGRWFTMNGEEVLQADRWFRRHCGKAVLIGRLVPTVRTLISIPAGIATMRLGKFLLYSFIGTLIWNAALVTMGYQLGENYDRVGQYLEPITKGVLILIVITYAYRVIRHRPRGEKRAPVTR